MLRLHGLFCLGLFLGAIAVASAIAKPCAGQSLALWDFSKDMQGWQANSMIQQLEHSAEGATFQAVSPDPFMTSPPVECPLGEHLVFSFAMRSTAQGEGQLFWGMPFSEADSLPFNVQSDGRWHHYRLKLSSPGKKTRFRLDPCRGDGQITLAWIRIESYVDPPKDLWASPSELRRKRMIGGGLYTIYGEETAITPHFLARHPEFVDSYPFDGIVLPAVLSSEWVEGLKLTKQGMPLLPKYLNELVWNKIRIPDRAVAQTLRDLQSMRRGGLTDNFLLYGMVDGARGLMTPDLANDEDWSVLRENAMLAARICREGRLQGIWLDTEQYGHYRWRTESGMPEFDPNRPQGHPFPLGLHSPQVLRRRGEEWIRAIQSEFPEIKIMTTFAWSPDALSYGPLKGTLPFLDGVLEGIVAPGQMIHAHENTFYFGQAKGTTHAHATENGFPGDRARYESARADIRGWRSLSQLPEKYDRFVQVGMAAWVEDHPWNVPDGWPSGSKATLWSNLPLALAYTDEYVWVWSEHTKYGQPHLRELNPFLASINHQTWNTKKEPVSQFSEDFAADPLRKGWYFDFDMLEIGRKATPSDEAPIMNGESIPYRWNAVEQALVVDGKMAQRRDGQRQRFVHPCNLSVHQGDFEASFEFHVDAMSGRADAPIIIGCFHSERSLGDQSLTVQIDHQGLAELNVRGPGFAATKSLTDQTPLQVHQRYRLECSRSLEHRTATASLYALKKDGTKISMGSATVEMPTMELDEVGTAFVERFANKEEASFNFRYLLTRVDFAAGPKR